MPFDSEGIFSRLHCWEDDRVNDIDIVTDHMDEEDDNFADGLSQCVLKNGNSKMEGDFNVGNFKIINVTGGNMPGDAVNRSQLDKAVNDNASALKEVMNALIKVGDIKASTIAENHDNWLLCDGSEVSRSDYADLFTVIGDKFGEGNGVTTFNVPDYRGRFLRGQGGNSAADIYTAQEESLPDHTHNITVSNQGNPDGGGDGGGRWQFWTNIFEGTQTTVAASATNDIYGGEHVTPENYAVYWFIKAKKEE